MRTMERRRREWREWWRDRGYVVGCVRVNDSEYPLLLWCTCHPVVHRAASAVKLRLAPPGTKYEDAEVRLDEFFGGIKSGSYGMGYLRKTVERLCGWNLSKR
jgi:hypothetical protein